MTKIVQLARGPRSEQDSYTGLEGELTIVTDIKEIRLHDGTTVGGNRILPLTENDLRYQTKSDIVSALISVNTKGILIRRAINDVVTRTITGTSGQIVVTNGDGIQGNPVLSLPSSISKAITFTQEITFSGGIVGALTGNVTGNLTGNVEGNLVGDTEGTHTGPVTGDASGDHTGTFTGDVDVRGSTLQLDADQIPLAAVEGAAAADSLFFFPVGGIIGWAGTIGAIPTGWVLCDGTNGTPNLTDKFIIGAGNTYAPGDTGGTETHDHGTVESSSAGSHNHTITVNAHTLTVNQIPEHKHLLNAPMSSSGIALNGFVAVSHTHRIDVDSSSPAADVYSQDVGGGEGHSHTASSSSTGAHTHDTDIPAGNHMPPYYALAFIMKTS